MGSIIQRAVAFVRRLVSMAAGLLPTPPSNEPAAPDLDGRRPTEADATAIRIDAERKAGHGGFR